METLFGKHWHHMPESEVTDLLGSSSDKGLDIFEIEHRKKRFGANRLTVKSATSPLIRFLLQFNQPLIYILTGAGFITLFLNEWVDAGVILAVVLVNAIVGFSQESKAMQAIQALSNTMSSKALVLRSGKKQQVDAHRCR